ncbi:MAG: hypothetical protein DMG39_20165 [Acidobacteria bacterium]|nr:MAG: hypothetical protein DMG39_20165 [Acidobacteriota bacterium]
MSALEQIVLWWFLNATWELPVCFICCWLFLRFVPNLAASIRHALWLAALTLGFLAPFGTLIGLWGDSRTMSSDLGLAMAARVNGSGASHLVLLIIAAPALYRAFLLLRGGIVASRLTGRATLVEPGTLESVLPKDLLLSIKRYKVKIFSTPSAISDCGPFTCGVRRPFILIPATLFVSSSRRTLVSVVAHELAHVQRRDMLLHLLSEIMLAPLAYHPFSYWLRSRLAEAREMACDARVSGPILPPTDYARCLLDVAETLNDRASPFHALGISESATLEHRIRALITFSPSRFRNLSAWNKCCLVLAAWVLFLVLLSSGRKTFLWMSAVPEPRIRQQMLRVPPPPPPPPSPNRR